MQIDYVGVPSQGRYTYTPTTKVEDVFNTGVATGTRESAYGWLSRTMAEHFGDVPVTAMAVYQEVTKPLKLNFQTTETLLTNATKAGFLKRGSAR